MWMNMNIFTGNKNYHRSDVLLKFKWDRMCRTQCVGLLYTRVKRIDSWQLNFLIALRWASGCDPGPTTQVSSHRLSFSIQGRLGAGHHGVGGTDLQLCWQILYSEFPDYSKAAVPLMDSFPVWFERERERKEAAAKEENNKDDNCYHREAERTAPKQ